MMFEDLSVSDTEELGLPEELKYPEEHWRRNWTCIPL